MKNVIKVTLTTGKMRIIPVDKIRYVDDNLVAVTFAGGSSGVLATYNIQETAAQVYAQLS